MEKNDREFFDKLDEQKLSDMKKDAEDWASGFPDAPAGQQRIDNTANRPAEWWREETDKIAGMQREENEENE